MRQMWLGLVLVALVGCQREASAGNGAAELGKPAPDFTLTDVDGKSVSLKDLRGKTVVLEWFNPGCPFVQYAHGDGPLASMAKQHAKKGAVWLAINSGAPGKQGHGLEANRAAAKGWAMEHHVLIDESGKVGRAYGAKTTPHMFVIDAKGILVYRGGLDNAPMGKVRGDALAPYTDDALGAVYTGNEVARSDTQPYGCSVKYD